MSTGGTFDSLDAASPRELTERWLRARTLTVGPELGTVEWLRLADRDKVSATCRAALAWFRAGDPKVIGRRLRMELEAERLVAEQYADAAWQAAVQRLGAPTETYAERRRRELEAAKRRPGDYLGGPLTEWDPR